MRTTLKRLVSAAMGICLCAAASALRGADAAPPAKTNAPPAKTNSVPAATNGPAAKTNAAPAVTQKPANNSKTNSAAKPKSAKQEKFDRRVEALSRFANGVSLELRDESEKATEQFYLAALADPANESLVIDVAGRLLRRKEYKKTVEVLRRAAELPDAGGDLLALLGFTYMQDGRMKDAIDASRAAIKKQPDKMMGYQTLFQVYLQSEKPKEALEVVDEAAKRKPENASRCVEIGELYASYLRLHPREMNDIKPRIMVQIDRAKELKAKEPLLLERMAELYRPVGEFARAAELYLQLQERFPGQPIFRERLTDLYLRGGDRKRAAEQLQSIIRDNPTNPQANYILGLIAYEEKEFTNAVTQFEKVILLNPEMEQAYYDLAGARISLDQSKEAIAVLEKARGKFKQNFVVELFTATAYNRMKEYAKAVRHLTAAEIWARANEPQRLTPGFYFQLGSTHERNKQIEQSEKYFEECLRMAPDYADALNYLGYMWAERGVKLDRAKEMIEKALKVEPENAAFLDSMAWVLFKLGKLKEAVPFMLDAIKRNKEPDATLYDHLGDIQLELKQPGEAREAWKKSLSIEPNPEVEKKLKALPEKSPDAK
jgi:tetratricopeptide (TPR) repeat protein